VSRPDPFPWLAHLRKDRRGLPVPYINAWGPEAVEHTRVEHDPVVGGPAVFFDDHGGVPDFTAQNPQRQRQCVVEGLCQVCGKPVPWSRRNLVLGSLSVEWAWVPELRQEVPMVYEPWLCDRCCAIATAWCPALIRRTKDEKLQVVKVRSQREVQLVVSNGSVDGFPEAGQQVKIWAKIQLLSVDIQREPTPSG
jgi:hypothetical protein